MTETKKKSKLKFPCTLPFRCTKAMYDKLFEKTERLGFDSASSYLRTLVAKDLKFNYIQEPEK